MQTRRLKIAIGSLIATLVVAVCCFYILQAMNELLQQQAEQQVEMMKAMNELLQQQAEQQVEMMKVMKDIRCTNYVAAARVLPYAGNRLFEEIRSPRFSCGPPEMFDVYMGLIMRNPDGQLVRAEPGP